MNGVHLMEQSVPRPLSGLPEDYNSQIVPPAEGSLPQAWLAVATTLTSYRTSTVAFAAWAGAATRQWVIVSLGVGLCLFWLNAIASSFFVAGSDSTTLHPLTHKDELILLLYPVRYLTAVLLIPLAVTAVTPRYFGGLGARFLRVMRPWSLAQVGMGVALAGWQLVKFAIVVATYGNGLLQGILLLPQGLAGWYTVILSVIALAVGAYRRPWIIVVIGGMTYELIYAGFPLLADHLALLLAIR
jgi:hypothetical protein